MEKIMDFLQTELDLQFIQLPYWALVAVGAVILILVVVAICLGTKSSKSKKNEEKAEIAVAQESSFDAPLADEVPPAVEKNVDAEVDPIDMETTVEKPELKDISTNEVDNPKVVEKKVAKTDIDTIAKKKVAPTKLIVEEEPTTTEEEIEEEPIATEEEIEEEPVVANEEKLVEEEVADEIIDEETEESIQEEVLTPTEEPKPTPVAPKKTVPVKKVAPAKAEPEKIVAKKPAPAKAPAKTTVAPVKKATPIKKAAPVIAEVEEDDSNKKSHPIILLTEMPADPSKGKYIIVKDESNSLRPFRYVLKANNGQILFESEGYKIKPRAKQIEAFKKTLVDGTAVIDSEKNGTFRFKLYNKDDKLFGVGEAYKTKQSAEDACESVKRFAASANFIEDTTVEEED